MATETEERTERSITNRPQVLVAILFGVVLTLVGIAGPIFGGGESGTLLIFGRNYLHDALHALSGIAGVIAGYYMAGHLADEYNKYNGIAYLLLFVLGFVFLDAMVALLNVNMADNFLHLFLGIVFAGTGYFLADRT